MTMEINYIIVLSTVVRHLYSTTVHPTGSGLCIAVTTEVLYTLWQMANIADLQFRAYTVDLLFFK